jgi:hypothetical protein
MESMQSSSFPFGMRSLRAFKNNPYQLQVCFFFNLHSSINLTIHFSSFRILVRPLLFDKLNYFIVLSWSCNGNGLIHKVILHKKQTSFELVLYTF